MSPIPYVVVTVIKECEKRSLSSFSAHIYTSFAIIYDDSAVYVIYYMLFFFIDIYVFIYCAKLLSNPSS